jgi:predicted dinucleotide-binding enzyme
MSNDLVEGGRRMIPPWRKFIVGRVAVATALLTCSLTRARAEETKEQTTKPVRIGVIGAGSLGGTVGSVLLKAGHEVKFSSRHPEELVSMTREFGPRASIGTPREAAEFGTVLLFAVPYEALPQLGRDLQEAIRGKIVLDACNARGESPIAKEAEANGVGPTSAKLLPGTRLVRDAGCEPVIVGNLAAGKKFERGNPGFRANTTAAKLRQLLGITEGK